MQSISQIPSTDEAFPRFLVHCTLKHNTQYNVHYTLHITQSTLKHYTQHNVHYILHIAHSTLKYCTASCKLQTINLKVHTDHFTLESSTLYTVHFTLNALSFPFQRSVPSSDHSQSPVLQHTAHYIQYCNVLHTASSIAIYCKLHTVL